MNILEFINTIVTNIMHDIGAFAPILACTLIIVESMLPILPLALFITINFYYMGYFIGFIVSYLLTLLGCFLSFKLCRKGLKKHFDNMLDKKEESKLKKLMKVINHFTITKLVFLIAIPFFPAFTINIAAGLSNMDTKKFLVSIIIGKIFLVIFWGFIGTSLLESITNPIILLEIVIMLIVAIVLSKIISKKLGVE